MSVSVEVCTAGERLVMHSASICCIVIICHANVTPLITRGLLVYRTCVGTLGRLALALRTPLFSPSPCLQGSTYAMAVASHSNSTMTFSGTFRALKNHSVKQNSTSCLRTNHLLIYPHLILAKWRGYLKLSTTSQSMYSVYRQYFEL